MMENTLQIIRQTSRMVLHLADPLDWPLASMLAGKVEDLGAGRYRYSLSTQNLEKIYGTFTGHKRPRVIDGQRDLDKMRQDLIDYRTRCKQVQEIVASERWPVPPNELFHPYAHQTKGIGILLVNPFTPNMMSCGLGKTSTVARAAEILLEEKKITKGKILVSAPLSILYPSWLADIQKFTRLKAKLLWTTVSNKSILGDREKLGFMELREPPAGALSLKTKEEVSFYNPDLKRIRKNPDELERAESPNWIKYLVSYKRAIMPDGGKIPYGEITGRTHQTDDSRLQAIRAILRDKEPDIFLINHDGVRIHQDMLSEHGFEWVIVDESTKIKSMQSKVTKAHIDISWDCNRRTIMSGTPNPNGYEDLWSQYYFLDRGLTLGTSLNDFRHEYFTSVITGTYKVAGVKKEAVKYVIRSPQDRDTLIRIVKDPGIYLEQRDCIDLPPRTDMTREVTMTEEQSESYWEMEDELATELGGLGSKVRAEAVNSLSKMMKLRQITSGFLINSLDQTVGRLDKSPKFEEMDALIEQLQGQKLLIICQFSEEIRQCLERYKHLGVATIKGGISIEERNRLVVDFQTTDNLQILVLQPQAASHGLTLTEAAYLAFLSLDYNYEFYHQVAKRIERIGQKRPMFVIRMVAKCSDGTPTIDSDLVDLLTQKEADRNSLFQTSETSIDDIAEVLRNRIVARARARHQ